MGANFRGKIENLIKKFLSTEKQPKEVEKNFEILHFNWKLIPAGANTIKNLRITDPCLIVSWVVRLNKFEELEFKLDSEVETS